LDSMKKLSEILEAQAALEAVTASPIVADPANMRLGHALGGIDVKNAGQMRRRLKELHDLYGKINGALYDIAGIKPGLAQDLETAREAAHQALLKEVAAGPDKFAVEDGATYMTARGHWVTSRSTLTQIAGIIGKYVEWQYPVLYVEPNTAEVFRVLVAGDPFYVLEDWPEATTALIDSLPMESKNKINVYTRATLPELPHNSMGLVVSWKNLMFKRVGAFRKDIALMAKRAMPGGYVMFDYVDASTVNGARAVEAGLCSFMWRERLLEYLEENQLELVEEHDFLDQPITFVVAKRHGDLPMTNLIGKLGYLIMDEDVLAADRELALEINAAYREMTSSLAADLAYNAQRDAAYAAEVAARAASRATIQQVNAERLATALKNLKRAQTDYPRGHPAVLEAVLFASKMCWAMDRPKDARGLVNRSLRDLHKLNKDEKIVKDFGLWIAQLDNT